MSKAYSKVFLSSLLFIASIIGWGLSMRNAEASSSIFENMQVENTSNYSAFCTPYELNNGFVKFSIDNYDNFALDFTSNSILALSSDGKILVRESRLNNNRWRYKSSTYKYYDKGQEELLVTNGMDSYNAGVRYQIWWRPMIDDYDGSAYIGEIRCYSPPGIPI